MQTRSSDEKAVRPNQIKSNQIYLRQKKNIMQHKKTKLICRQDTTALTSALQNKNTATGI